MNYSFEIKNKELQNKNIQNNARPSPDPDAGTPNLDFDPIRRLREKEQEPGGGVWAGPGGKGLA